MSDERFEGSAVERDRLIGRYVLRCAKANAAARNHERRVDRVDECKEALAKAIDDAVAAAVEREEAERCFLAAAAACAEIQGPALLAIAWVKQEIDFEFRSQAA